MIIFTPHRGSLGDAMEEAQEFNSEQEMKEHIVADWSKHWEGPLFTVDDVVIRGEPICDERIGWQDTRMVCVKRIGDEDFLKEYGCPQCIGYCATIYDTQKYHPNPIRDEDIIEIKLEPIRLPITTDMEFFDSLFK